MRDFVFPMFRANAIYEGEYLLGTSIARPLIAKRQIEIARQTRADAMSHGATGKGNDQVRFELGYLRAGAGHQGHRAVARVGPAMSREKLLAYAETHGIPIEMKHKQRRRALLDGREPAAYLLRGPRTWRTRPPRPRKTCGAGRCRRRTRPTPPNTLDLEYRRGDIVAINGEAMTPAQVLTELNRIGGKHGIGRLDLVENRYVGMKSRGCYETPGGTIMLKAHRAIESICLDREVAHLKDDLMPRYACLIYNGYWWWPERKACCRR